MSVGVFFGCGAVGGGVTIVTPLCAPFQLDKTSAFFHCRRHKSYYVVEMIRVGFELLAGLNVVGGPWFQVIFDFVPIYNEITNEQIDSLHFISHGSSNLELSINIRIYQNRPNNFNILQNILSGLFAARIIQNVRGK